MTDILYYIIIDILLIIKSVQKIQILRNILILSKNNIKMLKTLQR